MSTDHVLEVPYTLRHNAGTTQCASLTVLEHSSNFSIYFDSQSVEFSNEAFMQFIEQSFKIACYASSDSTIKASLRRMIEHANTGAGLGIPTNEQILAIAREVEAAYGAVVEARMRDTLDRVKLGRLSIAMGKLGQLSDELAEATL